MYLANYPTILKSKAAPFMDMRKSRLAILCIGVIYMVFLVKYIFLMSWHAFRFFVMMFWVCHRLFSLLM